MKFYLQSGYEGKEIGSLMFCLYKDQLLHSAVSSYESDYIPVGTVEFVESFIGQRQPDYYPDFLKDYFYRNIYYFESLCSIEKDDECYFIKPSDRHKRFDARIVSGYDKYEPKFYEWQLGPYWASEIVDFKEEWRYYVANGEILAAYWYDGEELEVEPPNLDVVFPSSFCGAVDFGRLYSGEIALVENNLPYACGWYGKYKDGKIYAEWLEKGWRYLQSIE